MPLKLRPVLSKRWAGLRKRKNCIALTFLWFKKCSFPSFFSRWALVMPLSINENQTVANKGSFFISKKSCGRDSAIIKKNCCISFVNDKFSFGKKCVLTYLIILCFARILNKHQNTFLFMFVKRSVAALRRVFIIWGISI